MSINLWMSKQIAVFSIQWNTTQKEKKKAPKTFIKLVLKTGESSLGEPKSIPVPRVGYLRCLFLEHKALVHSSFGTMEKRSQKPEEWNRASNIMDPKPGVDCEDLSINSIKLYENLRLIPQLTFREQQMLTWVISALIASLVSCSPLPLSLVYFPRSKIPWAWFKYLPGTK